jgi:hypothetical protein
VNWQFSAQPVPFARLRVGTVNDYSAVQALLETWLANAINQPLYLTNLNRLVNPVLANATPTALAVNNALNALNALFAIVLSTEATALGQDPTQSLDTILNDYDVEPVPAVDSLITTFLDKGSDLAVDTLLAGQFSAFFNMNASGTSYAGAVQQATVAVAMNDLPVRRYNRPEAQTSQLTGQAQSPDFEYTGSDLNEQLPGEQVDPPTPAGTPSNYGSTTGSQGAGGA